MVAYVRKALLLSAFGVWALLLSLPVPVQAADKGFPVVTGEHWMNATPQERMAFISGLTTMIELEKEVQGTNPPQNQKTLIPAWVQGLSRYSLKEIVDALDDVFRRKPEMKSRPVVEVIWYEVAFPKSDNK